MSIKAIKAIQMVYANTTKHDWPDDIWEAICQAIAEAEKQEQGEPVAWMHVMDNTEGLKANGTGIVSITQKRKHPFGKAGVDFSKSYPVTSTPLYTTPQQRTWVGLNWDDLPQIYVGDTAFMHGAKWAEAKLKAKNFA